MEPKVIEVTLEKLIEWILEGFVVLLLVDFILQPIVNWYNHLVLTSTMLNKLYH